MTAPDRYAVIGNPVEHSKFGMIKNRSLDLDQRQL